MWLTTLLAFVFPAIISGLSRVSLDFSVNYFAERNVPFICLITCENMIWDVAFTKEATAHSMSVSKLDIVNLSYKNVKQCFRQHFTTIGVLMNSQCGNVEHILYGASGNMWLDGTHIWLIINETEELFDAHNNVSKVAIEYEDPENSLKTFQILNNLNISVDADIILALQNGGQFSLFDVFNFGKVQGGSLVVTEAGLWCRKTGSKAVLGLNGYKYYKRWNFRQLAMRMISVATLPLKNFDPRLLTEIRPVPGISTITRSSTIALMIVAEVHNIKFVHTITDRWLGTYERNASRVVASAIYFREQDLSSALRLQKSSFDKISSILPALASLEIRYYYRIPTTGPGKLENQFLRPLSAGAWYSVVGVSALCATILIFAARLEARPSSVQYALFSVTASVCQQFFEDDTQTSRVSAARKLTILITGLSCVLIYNYYTSSVVSWLLSGPPPSINSLHELLESPLELIYQDVGYTRSWLYTPGYYFNRGNAKDEDDIRQKILRKKITSVTKPLEEGIAMVKAGGYAYHTETYSADTLISQTFDQSELCELGSLSSMGKTLLYPGVQKDSPYKEFLTWRLTRLLETGSVSCIQRRTTPWPASCKGSSPRALALGGAAPAFILLAFGFLMGTCIMLIEKFIYKIKVLLY